MRIRSDLKRNLSLSTLLAVVCGLVAVVLLITTGGCRHTMTNPSGQSRSTANFTGVQFEFFEYRGESATAREPGPNEFRNPILPGFYPDPSICRVGDDFYLVNSTFAYFPGVPIFHSTDLVNWKQIGHVLSRPSQLPLTGADVSQGIFAPSLSYHDGRFYMVTTNVSSGGNFYVTATKPEGPWSDPFPLNAVNGIDPSFFFDDEAGKAYLIHNGPPPDDKSLYSGHRALWLYEFDVERGNVKAETGKIVLNGGIDLSKKPVWIEGPHIYKQKGYYYLCAAEGGTGPQHSQVILRSKSVWGPYEPGSGNPILTQRDMPKDRANPITCVGHADLVQTAAGDWWAVFLACRPYDGDGTRTNLGRETYLLPVDWSGDWPIVLKPGEPLPMIATKPKLPPMPVRSPGQINPFVWRDDFSEKTLRQEWQFLRVPKGDWYSLGKGSGLVLTPRTADLTSKENPSFLAYRQQHSTFTATTRVRIRTNDTCDAGIVAFQNSQNYFFLGIRAMNGVIERAFIERSGAGEKKVAEPVIVSSLPWSKEKSQAIDLKIEGNGRSYTFYVRADNGSWQQIGERMDGEILSTAFAGGFVGTTIGPFTRIAGNSPTTLP